MKWFGPSDSSGRRRSRLYWYFRWYWTTSRPHYWWIRYMHGDAPALSHGRMLLFVHLRHWRWQPAWQKYPPAGLLGRPAGGMWEYIILGPVTIRYVYGDYERRDPHFWEKWK